MHVGACDLAARAFAVVAAHGHLTPNKLRDLPREDFCAVITALNEFLPETYAWADEAIRTGDRLEIHNALSFVCGWLNFEFDLAATRKLAALPEEERESVRRQKVTPNTWKRLDRRARWNTALRRRQAPACVRRPIARRTARNVRRPNVRRGSRCARAPGRPADDDDDSDLAAASPARGAA